MEKDPADLTEKQVSKVLNLMKSGVNSDSDYYDSDGEKIDKSRIKMSKNLRMALLNKVEDQ